jgi:hypothetical protein
LKTYSSGALLVTGDRVTKDSNFHSGSSRATIHDVYMQDLEYSIYLDYAWINQITSLRIQRCGYGVYARPQANATTIRDSVINNADESAVLFGNGEVLVLENLAVHHSKEAITILTRSWSVNIIGCYLERNYNYQIYIQGSDSHGEASWCRGINIIGNNIERVLGMDSNNQYEEAATSDIFVRLVDGVKIEGNNFRDRGGSSQPHHILFYDLDGGKMRNILIGANGFYLPEETAIAWTNVWEGNYSFPSTHIAQPYGYTTE